MAGRRFCGRNGLFWLVVVVVVVVVLVVAGCRGYGGRGLPWI